MPAPVPKVTPDLNARLNELLNSLPHERLELPALEKDVSWWQEMRWKFFNWIKQYFPENFQFGGADLIYTLKVIGVLVAAVLVIAICIQIWRLLSRFSKGWFSAPNEPSDYLQASDELNYALEIAEQSADFGLACRLRWRIWLRSHTLPSSRTPAEYYGNDTKATCLNKSMFGSGTSVEDYNSVKVFLDAGNPTNQNKTSAGLT